MKLSVFQLIFLCGLFFILFSKNSLVLNKLIIFMKSFLRYLKKYNSIKK